MAVTQDPVTTARFLFADEQDFLTPVGVAINADFLADEERVVRQLADIARFDPPVHDAVQGTARDLVAAVRKAPASKTGLDAFLRQYDLSSQEGVILMCLAEALLRIPDDDTADRLIADKLRAGDWASHLGDSQSLFVNASTWGLLLTGRIVRLDPNDIAAPGSAMSRVASRLGEPIVRTAMRQAMRIMGHQFVMGRTIDEALDNSLTGANKRYRYTFDMLGEAALTTEDADRYFESYRGAIESLAARVSEYAEEEARPSISVKLSALHPRFERVHRQRVLRELAPRLIELCVLARDAGIALTLDTEESERLEITVELLEAVCRDARLAGWSGFGMAVQGYQKRAPALLRYLIKLARGTKRTLHVRLVKGAYWDSEIKRAQERGLPGYPVYTRKTNTDVAYLACARILLEQGREIYPQFASHNAHTVAAVWHMARKYARQFEFQRLHGMGEELYSQVTDPAGLNSPCRVYAPVGNHEDLLPYLVRRLLENGSNTSFVNRIVNENEPIDAIVADPVRMVDSYAQAAHPRIPAPRDIYMPERRNSLGVHLATARCCVAWPIAWNESRAAPGSQRRWLAARHTVGPADSIRNPADPADIVGSVTPASAEHVRAALDHRAAGAAGAGMRPHRPCAAAALEKTADLFEESMPELVAMCVREAGKTVPDSVSEVREAVDFLRYYAARARQDFAAPIRLPGPTGESNELSLHGRGIFTCISPWNFPLAIFTGQVAAALAAGNAVLAKPAEQTPLVAAQAIRLMLQAGVPADVLHFLPGDGAVVGAAAVADPRVGGVAFTGSTDTARIINRALAGRNGPIATLIAETGGQNAMIVDSSALPEQVVLDAVQSSFNSAGQRCSALRVLCVQDDIADKVKRLLAGYMEELVIGNPALLETDVGPGD